MESKERFFQPEIKVAHPFLFRVQKNNTYLYFLGTNHQLPITVLPENIINYMTQSTVLCCERIGITKEEMDLLFSLEPFEDSPDNYWYTFLTNEAKEIIDRHLEPFVNKTFPNRHSWQLKPEWVMAELGAALQSGHMDIAIRNIFKKEKKELFQLDNSISIENWGQLRDHTRIQFDDQKPEKFSNAICMSAQRNDTFNNYLKETIKRQLEILESGSVLAPKELCEDRNSLWTIKLEKLINKHDSLFVAVGCSHFVGDTGLLNWLQKSNYYLELLNDKGVFEAFQYTYNQNNDCVIQ